MTYLTHEDHSPILSLLHSSQERGGIRLHVLVNIHWIVLLGQVITLTIVYFGLDLQLPIEISLGIVILSAAINLFIYFQGRGAQRVREGDAVAFFIYDIVQLFALLYLTGGILNPFSVLLLAPVIVSAVTLSLLSTLWLGGLVVLAYTFLAIWHLPLPLSVNALGESWIYIFGIWSSLVLTTLFLAFCISWVAREGKRLSNALAATQLALAREQKLSALGGLAAALAHELGSPLSTITVTAREIVRSLPADSGLDDEATMLLSQTERCRDILTRLVKHPQAHNPLPFARLSLRLLLDSAARPFLRDGIQLQIEAEPIAFEVGAEPEIAPFPELLHGLGALIQNAMQFARYEVAIICHWSDETISVKIHDDGPGFDLAVLNWLGEPYRSGRKSSGDHMGLGVFIAQTLLAHTGAKLNFSNRLEMSRAAPLGACVAITWPRPDLEEAKHTNS